MPTLNDAFASARSYGRTLVFGHRGACGYAPMNTLPSFEKVLELGADGTEFDVRLTKDRQMVILHDPTVDDTTNGHGSVCDLTLAEVRELDAGAWFGEKFRGTRIPTLDEVLETLGKRILINIEIKAENFDQTGVEAMVADAIARHGIADLTIVSSFNPITLRRFHQVAPQVPIGYLHHPAEPFFLNDFMHDLPHQARNPHHSEVTPRYRAWSTAKGWTMNVYTVNDPALARRLHAVGVDSVISDVPDVIMSALRD